MARKGPSPTRHLKQGARARILEAQLKRGWEIEAVIKRLGLCWGRAGKAKGEKERRPQPSFAEIRPLHVLLCLVKE